jgi:HEAT repeat protein
MSSEEKISPSLPEPYPGLRPYREDEQDKFFGRDADAEILIDKILTNRLTLLFAASGVGKSSLLQAAVIPHLRSPTGENLTVVYHIDWVSEPVRSVREAVVNALRKDNVLREDTDADSSGETLAELLEFCSLFVRPPLVLILDQFEEFFRYQRNKGDFQTFIDQLTAVIVDKSLPVSLVLSMREDFALELDAFKPKLPTILFENFYRLKKLEREATRRAIATPVEQLGYCYEPALLETLLTDLLSRELDRNPNSAVAELRTTVEPPYLQIVCAELWVLNKADPEKTLRLATYEKAGRAKGILKRYLDGVLQKFSADEKQLASRAFDHLVSHRGVKVAYTARALAKTLLVNEVKLTKILDRLENVRILRKQQREEEMWYELYHDMFSGSIEDWNTVWKDRMRRHYLLKMAVSLCASAAVLFGGWDYYINASNYHLRLSPKAGISDRVEVWQGKLGSMDLFGQQHYLAETDFTRHDLEPDKLFEKRTLADNSALQTDLIGAVPVDRRVAAYAASGEYPMGLDLAKKSINPQQIELAKKTLEQLADVSTKEAVQLMYENLDSPSGAIKETASKTITITGGIVLARDQQNITPEKQAKHTDFWVEQWKRQIATGSARKQLIALGMQKVLLDSPALLEKEFILSSLKDEDSDVRAGAVRALGWLKATEAIPDLRALLKDEDSDVRSTAVGVLVSLKATEAIPDLRALLKDEDSKVRFTAAEALVSLKTTAAIPDLLALLKDKDWNVRSRAVEALVSLKATEAIPDLRALLKGEDSDLRSTAAEALVSLKATEAIPDLRALLKDGESSVSYRAAEALVELKATEAIPDLLALLKDGESSVSYRVTEALISLKTTEAIPDLLALLKDGDSDVRSSAAGALGGLKATAAVPDLRALLKDENSGVRSTAAEALVSLKATEAIPDLRALLKDEDSDLRSTAAEALVSLKATEAIPDLRALLKDEDSGVRFTAAKVLGGLKATETGPDLLTFGVFVDLQTQESFENMTPHRLSSGDFELSSSITSGGLLGFLIHNLKSAYLDNSYNSNNAVMSALHLERSGNLTEPQKHLLQKALSLVNQQTRDEATKQLAEEDAKTAEEKTKQVNRPINQPGLEEKPLSLEELKARLDEFDQAYGDWRERRDDAALKTDTQTTTPASPNEPDKFADPVPFIYEYAFAIANTDAAEGIKLLGHNLYKVREAAARGLANSDFLNVALLKKLEQQWLTTDAPIERQGLYHAIDLCLSALETIGGQKELTDLNTYLQELNAQTLPNTPEENQPPSVKSIKPRVEWTQIQIDWREGAMAELNAITDKQMPDLLKEYCLNPDGTDMKPEECTIER